MPVISRFYGIVIRMFYNDHIPPYFHAVYGEHELLVSISPIAILQGQAPSRVRSMVLEWTALHQLELVENWNRCRRAESPILEWAALHQLELVENWNRCRRAESPIPVEPLE